MIIATIYNLDYAWIWIPWPDFEAKLFLHTQNVQEAHTKSFLIRRVLQNLVSFPTKKSNNKKRMGWDLFRALSVAFFLNLRARLDLDKLKIGPSLVNRFVASNLKLCPNQQTFECL